MASVEDDSQPCPSDAEFLELEDEPSHQIVLENECVRAYYTELPPGHTTLLHRHAQNTYTVFLRNARIREQRPGELWSPPKEVAAYAGYCKMYHQHPIVHRIQALPDNIDSAPILAVEARPMLRSKYLPTSSSEGVGNPLESVSGYTSLSEGAWEQVQPHKLVLAPGETTGMHTLSFPGVALALTDGALQVDVDEGVSPFGAGSTVQRAHIWWFEPPLRHCITNVGHSLFEAMILQLR